MFSLGFHSTTGHGELTQAVDGLEDRLEQLSRHRRLRQLEDHLPGMTHDFRLEGT